MDESANGYGPEAGVAEPAHANGDSLLPQIHEALEVVHGAYSSNEARQTAYLFLETLKATEEAPYHGYVLASEKQNPPVVRHYALSLLEHAVKYKWAQYSHTQAEALKDWVLQLSQHIAPDDPLYLRNKTAQLWVEIAKRSWAGSRWTNMDELLVHLWNIPGPTVHKEFVLFVLENLSEEVFNGEDSIASMREAVLSKACVEIFTPASVLAEAFPNRQVGTKVRFEDEGWLARLGSFLDESHAVDIYNSPQWQTCVIKVLAVYRSVMPWAIPQAIRSAFCVPRLCGQLGVGNIPIQLASVEVLHALYGRLHFSTDDFVAIVCPMYTKETVDLLRKLFEWSVIDPYDIDDEKYLFSKKLSEMMANLGTFLEQRSRSLPKTCDLPSLLGLFSSIAQSQSFVVSIPILVTWTRLLHSSTICEQGQADTYIPGLLELCSSRLIRYENMPEDTQDASLVLLLEDIDTLPDRHAFLGNYRRYSGQIIELIVRKKQSEAVYHILNTIDHSMQHLYDGLPPFSVENYSKTSLPAMRVDANFAVVEATLKGHMKGSSQAANSQRDEQERLKIEDCLESWCNRLLKLKFEDPVIRKRIQELAVAILTSALDKRNGFMLVVLEHLLMVEPNRQYEGGAFSDAVKDLHTDAIAELRHLASKMPNQLLEVYDHLEAKVNEIIASGGVDEQRKTLYRAFLFTIIHRTNMIQPEVQLQKLQTFVGRVQESWQNPEIDRANSSFNEFCELLGLNMVQDYIVSRRMDEIQDWGSCPLDAEGQAIQKELERRKELLPLQATKILLGCSTEKLSKDSVALKVSKALWRGGLSSILPNLLKFLAHAHACYNAANWGRLPDNIQPVVQRILTDRFWQAGISEGSKDDFYNRVSGTKITMEGFASSIRGSVRLVRECSYSVLWSMSRLDVDFYGFNELPGPLAHALFADANYLSSHQLIALLNVVRLMVDDCPVELRDHFVPPILATCFAQLDAKYSSNWERLTAKQAGETGGDLTEEMKQESLLRQLTHTVVMMICDFFDPGKSENNTASVNTAPDSAYPAGLRQFCLSSGTVLEQLLLFSAHTIRMRDSRCCSIILRIFRSIIPEFALPEKSSSELSVSIREFMSTEVLKACITSLNEPYFVELQRDLALAISLILYHYSPLTQTPRNILASLPGISHDSVVACIEYIGQPGISQRQQRAVVLDLLRNLKGISISEQGRVAKSESGPEPPRKTMPSKMQQEFLRDSTADRKKSPDLEGIAEMFA